MDIVYRQWIRAVQEVANWYVEAIVILHVRAFVKGVAVMYVVQVVQVVADQDVQV